MFSTSHFHPMLVHFPIALVTIGFLADLVSLFIKKELCFPKISFYLLIIGTLASIATVLSGVLFTSEMSGAAGEAKETHVIMAFITLALLIITSVFRILLQFKPDKATIKWLAFVLYALAAICVSITGFFGGNLVYGYMMPI